MGEAMLVRRGGASFRELYAVQNPDKMEYTKGQYPDMDGAIIGAKFGSIGVPLHDSAWTYANNPLTLADPNIHISAQIGRYTKTMDIPVTVNPYSETLDDNDWETIAEISAAGLAREYWNIGDVKYFTYNGARIAAKIIGFDHTDLHANDAKYNSAAYNGGLNKAGITFQFFDPIGRQAMHNNGSGVYWANCNMRTSILPAVLLGCPQDMQSVIRTAKVYSPKRNYASEYSADKLFLLNALEHGVDNTGDTQMNDLERQFASRYEYYRNGGSRPQYDFLWTRSVNGLSGYSKIFVALPHSVGGGIYEMDQESDQYYFPVFCV